MRLAIIGSGYVGLVAGACFADSGNDVWMVDKDARRIEELDAGGCPIYEPGLPEILDRNREAGRIHFTTDLPEAVRPADVVFLAVGTPPRDDGSVDLSFVQAAAQEVGRAIDGYTVVVLKSTVPMGTNARVRRILASESDATFSVVSNPEFLKEGTAVEDFRSPVRVVLGTDDPRALAIMRRLYSSFMRRSERILVMDPLSAEVTKYACNAMLAVRVSFMNELSRLCEAVGANIDDVRHGMGTDPRIGPQFLYASLGFGGSCLPKDIQALAHFGGENGVPQTLVQASWEANLAQQRHFAERVDRLLGDLGSRTVAMWGLAFKARTDDVRSSAALGLARHLLDAGASLRVHDPEALHTAREALGDQRVAYFDDMYMALEGADALVIGTEWNAYRQPDFERMAALMRRPLLLDGRNLYKLEWMAQTPFEYHSVGRPPVMREGSGDAAPLDRAMGTP